jgi:uncharacterized protein YgbK (DUF1537 family)
MVIVHLVYRRFPLMFFRTNDYDLLATNTREKTPKEAEKYYLVFKKKWKQLAGGTCAHLYISQFDSTG